MSLLKVEQRADYANNHKLHEIKKDEEYPLYVF